MAKQTHVTYEDLPALGVTLQPRYIRKLMRAGKFVEPIEPVSRQRKTMWKRSEVIAWAKERK